MLTCTTTQGQSGPGSNDNKGVLQNSQSDADLCYTQDHSFERKSYLFAGDTVGVL